MQYLKEEIRSRILAAALTEFHAKGFQKASMINIAREAEVAIGNIYHYFKNKSALFSELIKPAYESMQTLVFDRYKSYQAHTDMPFDVQTAIDALLQVYQQQGKELIIMMDQSEGSKYHNTKEKLVTFVYERQKNEYQPLFMQSGIGVSDLFFYVISYTFIESIFVIFKKNEDIPEIKKQIDQLLVFYFSNFIERFA